MHNLVLALALAPALSFAAIAPPVVGDWQSSTTVDGHTLRWIIHITHSQTAGLAATMDSPDENATNMTLSKVDYRSPKLHFDLDIGRGTFDGTYDIAKDEITGAWATAGRQFPMVLKRAARISAQPSTAAPGLRVSTAWLQQHLDDPQVHVIFIGDRGVYDRAHIPGARFLDHMETLGAGHRLLPPAELAKVLAGAGAADGGREVLYGSDPMATGWLYMAIASVGHASDVSMLDGGIELWRAEHRPVESKAPPMGHQQLTVQPAPDLAVDAEWVRNHLESPEVRLLDVRTTDEWKAGHLPGATLILWLDLFTDRHTLKLKSPDELRALFAQAGVKPGQQVVTYCAIGMRASLMYWAALSVGLPAHVYVGSYSDWKSNPSNPIVH